MNTKVIVPLAAVLFSSALFSCGGGEEKAESFDTCSFIKEASKAKDLDTTNELGYFSGGRIGPLIKGQTFSTTIDFEAKNTGGLVFQVYFVVGAKRTRVGGSSVPEAYTSSSIKKSHTITVPSSLLVSSDGGTFSVSVRKTSGSGSGKTFSFDVPVPLATPGETKTYDCGEPVEFPSYFYYWKGNDHLTPSPLSVSIDASEERRLTYREQDDDTCDYLRLSHPAIKIDYPGANGADFKIELWLYDHFEDFPLSKSGDHIVFPMTRFYTYGGGIHLSQLADNYYFSRRNLLMRGPGSKHDGDINSRALYIPIGRGHVKETYRFVLHVYDIGLTKVRVKIPGTFVRHYEHFGNPFVGEYHLSCGLGE